MTEYKREDLTRIQRNVLDALASGKRVPVSPVRAPFGSLQYMGLIVIVQGSAPWRDYWALTDAGRTLARS